MGGHLERDPAAFLLVPEAFRLQVRIETPLGLLVRVRHVVAPTSVRFAL